jgi:class 3 adenylate cyclase
MAMAESVEKSKVLTLVFTDLVDSTALKTEHGDSAVNDLLSRHRNHVAKLASDSSGQIIDWAGDGCFLTFETSSAAVMFALQLQQAHAAESDLPDVRIGIHLGEITETIGPDGAPQVKGLAVDVAARIEGLAKPGQILMSTTVYDNARQRLGVDTFGEPILWRAHGSYKLKGVDKPFEISEAGIKGVAPMSAPKAGEKAKRVKPWSNLRDSTPREQNLPEVTRRFRLYGYVLFGLSFIILYVALQYQMVLSLLGYFLTIFFGGLAAIALSRSTYLHHRKMGSIGKLPTRYRRASLWFLRFGVGLILLGALLLAAPSGKTTFYVLSMVGIPFCAIGGVQLLFSTKISSLESVEPTPTPNTEENK